MTRQAFFLTILSLLAFLGIISCSDATTSSTIQPNVVKQKITPQAAVSEQVLTKTAPEIASESENMDIESTGPAQSEPDSNLSETMSNLIEETLEIASTYDPKGRFDPFEPLFKEEPSPVVRVAGKKNQQRRQPTTPLEKVALNQLKLSAVIRAPSGNRGLVIDATGKGYVVEKGTYIGLNSGRVTKIDKDRIVVEEDIEDIMGELKIQLSELTLQKPAGEL